MKALLLLLLAIPAAAENPEQIFPLPLFRDGLYTRYSANAIPDGGLAEALNVTLDEDVDGTVVARRGYSKYNTSAILDSKTVRGLWSFDATDGTKYLIAFSSTSFFKSSGDGTWTQITGLNGFSLTKEFDCTTTIGKFWCGNGDVVFSWDGTSTHTVSGAPLGNLVSRFRNRVLIAGVSGSKGRLLGSGELDGTDFTIQIPGVSTTPISLAFGGADDGEEITCLMGAYQDAFIVGKRNSLWALYGFGRTDFQIRELSREVGCIDRRSVREKNNCLYWMSLRGIEKFCGASIVRISDPIRDKLDTIVASAGNARSALDTAQGDFDAGNLAVSGPLSTISSTISPGSIVASTFSRVDDTIAEFEAGTRNNISTVTSPSVAIALSRSSILYPSLNADFATGDATNWSLSADGEINTACNGAAAGAASVVAGGVSGYSYSGRLSVQKCSASFPSFNCGDSGGGTCTSSVGPTASFTYRLIDGNGSTVLGPSAVSGCPITVNLTGLSTDYVRIAVSGSSLGSASGSMSAGFTVGLGASMVFGCATSFSGTAVNDTMNWSATIMNAPYVSTGSYFSPVFDTGISTPIGGTFSVSSTTPSGTTLSYQVRSATSAFGVYSAWTAQSESARIPLTQRYWQYMSSFTTTYSSYTPTVQSVTLIAATTGQFISQCRNPSSGITSWGLFSCTEDPNGGSLTYYVSTGTTCNSVTRTTATWNTQGNNATIALSTAAYVAYKVLFDLDSGTETPRVRDCTINWQEGETRPPVASSVYQDRYYLAYTSSTAQGSANDHLLVLDKNDKWTLFDNHSCYSLANYERKLYCGSATNLGQVWRLDNSTSDDGDAILTRVRTKAFNMGIPERRKSFSRLYLDLEPSPDPTQTITLTGRYTLERSTPVYSLGNIDLNEDPGSIITAKAPFPLENPTSGRYIQLELESNGTNSPWRLFSGRLYFKPLDPE